jgi:hypothetical protein
MKARGKSRPIEVCHPVMATRAIKIIWKTGVNCIIEAIRPWNFWKSELWVWDEESVQPWTRSFIGFSVASTFLPREAIGRYIHHPLKRWTAFLPPA